MNGFMNMLDTLTQVAHTLHEPAHTHNIYIYIYIYVCIYVYEGGDIYICVCVCVWAVFVHLFREQDNHIRYDLTHLQP